MELTLSSEERKVFLSISFQRNKNSYSGLLILIFFNVPVPSSHLNLFHQTEQCSYFLLLNNPWKIKIRSVVRSVGIQ